MPAPTLLHPVGPRPPGVYWARRAVALAVIVAIVGLLAYACAPGGSGKPRPAPPTPSPSQSATAAPVPQPCLASRLTLAVSTDATSYPAGVLPRLRVTIRTAGPQCTLPSRSLLWEIVSGADRVWTTAGCGSVAAQRGEVQPNHPAHFGLVWDRHRSVAHCASPGTAAGNGTYQLFVTVRGARSAPAVFHLTG